MIIYAKRSLFLSLLTIALILGLLLGATITLLVTPSPERTAPDLNCTLTNQGTTRCVVPTAPAIPIQSGKLF